MTFASFLTPEGIIVAAGLITTLIALIRATFSQIDTRVSGALLAFIISAVVYVLTAITVGITTPDVGLTIFAAWLTCATSSVGVHSAIKQVRSSDGPNLKPV